MKENDQWRRHEAQKTYNIERWGNGYFSINDQGHITVKPVKDNTQVIDLKVLIDELLERGIQLPVLIRFSDILRHRIEEIHQTFQRAINDCHYKGKYFCVFPIKVNQQRHVVEDYLRSSKPYGFGLEAGSKPELLAVLALSSGNEDTPIICNGFKDEEYLRMVLLAQKLGKTVIPVVERFNDLRLIVQLAQEMRIRPILGMRVKLASQGSGRWKTSAGFGSKFGLTVAEVMEGVKLLDQHGMKDCLELLHFHMGSQITNIQTVKSGVLEAARIYSELSRLGTGMKYLNVGGGLGVDYDGSQTDFESSMNYTLQEYANDVVFHVMNVCDQAGVAHPILISESGRAVMAYHSLLAFEVLGASQRGAADLKPSQTIDNLPLSIRDLMGAYHDLNAKNVLESYHDAVRAIDDALSSFSLGHMNLEMRAMAEHLYFSFCHKLVGLLQNMDYVPEELQDMPTTIADTYFCNFSLFQSLPDSWAIDQIFPIMPVHRLNEMPKKRAVLADLTCDSDGKINRFADLRDIKAALEVHDLNDKPYYLAAFLLGAYQETLGDLHNLFGDTNAVHVSIDRQGMVQLDQFIKGDTVREVLSYIQYSADELLEKVRLDVERAVRTQKISLMESKQLLAFYEDGLDGYTYLE